MKHVIIGTAGHIDHGKTALIKALTGRNTDRWKEEQVRGITIDLGFTWIDLKDGNRAGIIDVPGHEKFIRHMVAGVVGMDLVLLVIAADEGIMPQTKEHMDILELLGVESCIVVLNKCDLVEADWLELVTDEIKEQLQGTIFEKAPVVCVSSVTGQGLDALEDEIIRQISEHVIPRDVHTIPRLPIDRAFSVSGFGTVVTGTLISGRISKDDLLCVYPDEKLCKVRNIQVHEQSVETCEAGHRVALNIAGLKKEDVKRGCVIAPVDHIRPATVLDVKLNMLAGTKRTLKNQCRLHLYSGTSEVLCRAILLDKEEIGPGEAGLVQLRLEHEVATKRGDRFLIRYYSPVETIGGGVILEVNSDKKKRFDEMALKKLKQLEHGSLADAMDLQLQSAGRHMLSIKELASMMAHASEELMPYVQTYLDEGSWIGYQTKKDLFLWHANAEYEVRSEIRGVLLQWHKVKPYRPGMSMARLHTEVCRFMKPNIYQLYVDELIGKGVLKRQGEWIALADFEHPEDELFCQVRTRACTAYQQAGFHFLRLDEVDFGDVSMDTVRDILELLCEQRKLVKLTDDIYTLMSYMDEILRVMRICFEHEQMITITYLKDVLDTTRKNIRSIFEYTDRMQLTQKTRGESEREKYLL